MKKYFVLFAITLAVWSCGDKQPSGSEEGSTMGNELAYEVAKNYFFKNNVEALPASPKITNEDDFNKYFGMATTMGENGKPTAIDFSKQFALAVILPVTNINTEIVPGKIEEKGDSLFYTFDVKKGEKMSSMMQPCSIILLDKQYEDKEVILINEQLMLENMKEVQAYLKDCGAFFIATVDGDQPRVRPFGVSEIIDDRLYIMTGKVKNVYKQMAANGKFEICALKKSGTEWMRLSGVLVTDETLAVKEEFLERNPGLKSMYKADDDNMALLQITNATATFCSFSAPDRKVNF